MNNCEICHGTTLLRDEHGGEFRCKCFDRIMKERKLKDIKENSHIRGLLAGFTFDTFDTFSVPGYETVKSEALMYAKGRGKQKSLLIHGASGMGKTHLATAIAQYRIKHHRAAMFQIAPELAARWRELATDGVEAARFMEMLIDVELLVIDDYGAQYDTPFSDNQFYLVYNRRWLNEKATVTTSNTNPRDLPDRLRLRVATREFELIPLR